MQSISTVRHCYRTNGVARFLNFVQRFNHNSTIDTNDVEHHSKLADGWWNPQGPVAPLHSLNKIRVPFIRDGLVGIAGINKDKISSAKPLENVKILEIGCGAGILTEQLARIHAQVVAIDPSDVLIQTAHKHLQRYPPSNELSKRIEYRSETIEEHNSRTSTKYDAVVVSEVLEHVDDKETFLKLCTAPLRSGGSIFITTFNKTTLAWLGGIVCAEYILNMIPQGTHDWNKFISPRDTQKLLEQCGCSTVICNGFLYEFWRQKWIWTKHNQFSYALQAVKS
ncbi:ubiquinone biosynthesis O-methyltransferase, mitochondrial [Contarinia nasturtii]|uniref:ubiquinone biosynthesis O-methyltransferase, mitochondrial n=1 Tax=Contarinia nasturtii TaxID=265458 RepID=UPI0012D4517F|nr:ubiquinone biosynthesis O-methyltransferase, mitochondrial [Contarinia nasturtii]